MNAYYFSLFLILLDFIRFFHDTDHKKSNLSANIQIIIFYVLFVLFLIN